MSTITARRRSRSPRAFLRKDARNAIYRAMYGQGNRNDNYPPAFDPSRKHADPQSVSWLNVASTLQLYWRNASFDQLTARKIVSDFQHYCGGKIELTIASLEKA